MNLISGFRSEAYPTGIPQKIIDSEHDHRKPYKGDNELLFIPVDEEAINHVNFIFGLL